MQDGRRDFPERSVGARPKGGCHLITAFVCKLWVSCCHRNPIRDRKLAVAGCFLSRSVLSRFCFSCILLRRNLAVSSLPSLNVHSTLSGTKLGSRKQSWWVRRDERVLQALRQQQGPGKVFRAFQRKASAYAAKSVLLNTVSRVWSLVQRF